MSRPWNTNNPGLGGFDELTASEEATVAAINNGTYFVYAEVPTGIINGSNVTFTLANTPAPTNSLMLVLQGVYQIQGTHYTLSGTTITFESDNIPQTGMQLVAPFYTVAP